MNNHDQNYHSEESQLGLFEDQSAMVHYYDKNGALRTGRILRRIKKGKKKGRYVVIGMDGKSCIPDKIRNIQ